MSRTVQIFCILTLLVPILFLGNLFIGSVSISPVDVACIILDRGNYSPIIRYIVMDLRLPQAITALLAGAVLACSGLLLQSAFRNPLAGPGIFGISGGAGLFVALTMLGASTLGFALPHISILAAAFIGAMIVTTIILIVATVVKDNTLLLIIGIMIGYLTSSAITILNFFASEQGVKSYAVWSMGTFSDVSMDDVPLFALLSMIGIIGSMLLVKPLNAMQLGPQYAFSLGINIRLNRLILLAVTGLLVAIATAWCGPISFIGLAVPHIARLCIGTSNHRILLPATTICGCIVGLICNLLCNIGSFGMLPLNAVTPFVGAPVIIYVLLKHK